MRETAFKFWYLSNVISKSAGCIVMFGLLLAASVTVRAQSAA
jgi:hypothetical protein